MNAFLVASMAVGIGAAIVTVNSKGGWGFTLLIFLGAVGTMVAIVLDERKKAAAKPTNKVDHAQLAATNLVAYATWLKENVRGHDTQIDDVVNSIQEELGLARPGKIIGAYMLIGPTGTGKTFLAQLIAQCLYPQSEMILLRMNSLKHPDDVFTLIGPPPGRPGYEVGGSLTRPVLQNPYRVVIFDEIDMCHPDLHHCLYDILDTGQCREKSSGKMVDFSGCVFFGTTNAGNEGNIEKIRMVFNQTLDFNQLAAKSRDALHEAVGFSKPFLARWTRLVFLDRLEQINVAEVALLQLCHYWKDYGIEVSYVPPELLLEAVSRNEEFQNYGVRQLSTLIRQRTNQAIAQARAAKMNRVHLDVSPEGQLVVKPIP
jgi:ATP-dependent Clp protease ATP-binding subunit ClpC